MSTGGVSAGGNMKAWMPSRTAWVDMAMVLTLGVVAFYGFHDTFANWLFLIAGTTGLVIGILVAHASQVLGLPAVVTVVMTVVAFFLLGGAVAMHDHGILGSLPLPDTLLRLAEQSVRGWKELLTTLPPVDSTPLVALPYLLGLVAGATGFVVAVRFKRPVAPVVVLLALLSAVILLGVQTPNATMLLGAVFGVLALGWTIVRARRLRSTTRFTRRRTRQRVIATVLCLGAAAAAFVVGPHLPGLSDDRTVLRSHVEPPFDVGQYPSPLAGFRKYTDGVSEQASLKDKVLMTVRGPKPGTLVRFAALNAYDGTTWGAANDASTESGPADTFQKVGSTIDSTATGDVVSAEVTINEAYRGVWMPTIGTLRGINFQSPRLRSEADNFRYNISSATAVVPAGLQQGDSYSFDAVLPKPTKLQANTATAGAPLVNGPEAAVFQADAVRLGGQAETPVAQAQAVARQLQTTGAFTHGGIADASYPAGHSSKRMRDFLATDREPAGDDEQYAAAMALLANQLGVPTRVVLGAALPASGEIRGSDVHAWVEMRAEDGTWLTMPTSDFMSTERPPEQHRQKEPDLEAGITVPPPVPVRPPATVGDPVSDSQSRHSTDKRIWDFTIPWYVVAFFKYVGLPLVLIAAVLWGIVLLKSRRRRHRRTSGSPDRRFALGYLELLDHARDLGKTVPGGRTRREQAHVVAMPGYMEMARAADAGVFGAGDPTDADAEDYWGHVDAIRDGLTKGLSRWGRLRFAVNLASFRPLSKEHSTP